MIDHNGYPTEATLKKIAEFDPRKDDVYKFVEYLCENWVNGFPPEWNKRRGTLQLSTGGWSGCESVIGALQRGGKDKIPWFWTLYWYQSRVGGHYIFQINRNPDTREIPLTQDQVAIIDPEDFYRLNQYVWFAEKDGNTHYASRNDYESNPRKLIRMHRVIIDCPNGMEIDHINGNGLDNRKENLRIVTRRQNLQNLHSEKSSKYPGISWVPEKSYWRVRIQINGKRKSVGCFKSELDAAKAYVNACSELLEEHNG